MLRPSRGWPRGPGRVVRGGALGLRRAGLLVIVVRLLGAVVEHERLGLVGDGDSAGALGPRLPVHLHGHRGALEDQLEENRIRDFNTYTFVKKILVAIDFLQ